MKKLLAFILLVPFLASAQSGSFGGGSPTPPEKYTPPPLETATWRGTGTGIALSRLDACKDARRDGNQKTEVQSFRLQRDAYRVIKGSSMSDCMCEGPAAGGWHNCMVDISVTHTNR
jgi:hypothetical protein